MAHSARRVFVLSEHLAQRFGGDLEGKATGGERRYKALWVEKIGKNKVDVRCKMFSVDDLPEGDITVAVKYSSLNYKDALAITGRPGVVKKYPIIPGIDLAGIVTASNSPSFREGDKILATGLGLGVSRWGGYTQLTRLKSNMAVHVPSGFTCKQTMMMGVAGFTAMVCIEELRQAGVLTEANKERNIKLPILVTGAGGGVGGFAIAILSNMGWRVAASTGRKEQLSDYLHQLGATEIIDRNDLATEKVRPLSSQKYLAAVDSVGGYTLANVLSQTAYGGAVACVGVAGGAKLPTYVFPFILRGIKLIGVDSVKGSQHRRVQIWTLLEQYLATSPKMDLIADHSVIKLEQLEEYAKKILEGNVKGRVVIEL